MTEIEDPAEAVDDERLEAELEERNEERRGEVRGDPVLRKAYAYSKERDRGGGIRHHADGFRHGRRHGKVRDAPEEAENDADHDRIPDGLKRSLCDRRDDRRALRTPEFDRDRDERPHEEAVERKDDRN